MHRLIKVFIVLIVFPILVGIQGCTCCVYFNHMFNTERAYAEGMALRQSRLDSIPADSNWSSKAENEKWDKVIKKGSAVLERYPNEEKHKPMAIFYIGEAFRMKGECEKALVKYNEFDRYFNNHDSITTVQFQRANCYYQRKEFATAKFALEPILSTGDKHPYYSQSLDLLSKIDENQSEPLEAIANLEKLLQSPNVDEFMKAKAHYRLAQLYFQQKDFTQAKKNYDVNQIKLLSLFERYNAAFMSAECSAELKEYAVAEKKLIDIISNKEFQKYHKQSRIRLGEVYLLEKKEAEAYKVLKEVIGDTTATVEKSHAWFLMGDYEQSVKGQYETAIEYYESSRKKYKYNEWAMKSRERVKSLKEYLSYLKKKNDKVRQHTVTPEEDFVMAELFLFRLDEVDSALIKLDKILEETTEEENPDVRMQVTYAQAFIYDEFKDNDKKADSIYRYIIEKYPNSKYAQQAQVTLGVPLTVKTQENLAHDDFIIAENLFDSLLSLESKPSTFNSSLIANSSTDSIQSINNDSKNSTSQTPDSSHIAESINKVESSNSSNIKDSAKSILDYASNSYAIDSLYEVVINKYDSIYHKFPDTKYAAKALFVLAWIYENHEKNLEKSKEQYQIVVDKFPKTDYGEKARQKLDPRLLYNERQIENARNIVDRNKLQRENIRKAQEERRLKEEKEKTKVQADTKEVLSDDYEDLYDLDN